MIKTSRLLRSLLLMVAFAPLVGCQGEGEPEAPRRIFLVTVDTLRADHLGAYGYERATSPSIDRLAGESVRFDRAVAQWPFTGPSFASIMSGQYPRSTGRKGKPHVSPPDGVVLIPEFLREQGYTTVAVVSNLVLSSKAGWDRGFDEYLETWAEADEPLEEPARVKRWLTAKRVNEMALPLLARHREAEKLFVWLHYSDPHTPYTLPDDFENPFVSDDESPAPVKLNPNRALPGFETVGEYVANYDANILIADRGVGEALDRAEELGLLEDSLVIFTADHGESLGEHNYYFTHGNLPYNASSHVPLIIRDPKRFRAGSTVAAPVELIDIYATLRDLVAPGSEADAMPGASLVGPLLGASEPRGVAIVESRQGAGVLLGTQDIDWKLVTRMRRKQGELMVTEELYRMSDDPGETRNLIGSQREAALSLRRSLGEWLERTAEAPDVESPDIDDETRRALEALGYLDSP